MQNVFGTACRALAELTASWYRRCVDDGSLFELDATAFSMVLAQDAIAVESESTLLEHAVRWASRVGRTAEMVSRVLPRPGPMMGTHRSTPYCERPKW